MSKVEVKQPSMVFSHHSPYGAPRYCKTTASSLYSFVLQLKFQIDIFLTSYNGWCDFLPM